MRYLLFLAALIFSQNLFSQETPNPPKIKLFLDCQRGCDFSYFRQELKYVDFMRDRQGAEVFMQLIRQRSGNGGNQYSLQIIGQEKFTGILDTLVFFTNPEDSDNIQRKAILKNVQTGLLPFLLKSDWQSKLSVEIEVLSDEISETIVTEDPWDNWVFQTRANGHFNGESSFTNSNINTRFTASRVTAESKFFVSGSLNQSKTKFELTDGTEINRNNSSSLFILYAKSLSDHWSMGGFVSARSSDFSNIDNSYSIKPAIEYSIFPYSENTTREFKLLYRIGLVYNNYNKPTTFNLTEQHILQQNLDIEYKIIKDWGSIGFDFEVDNYPRDVNESSVSFGPDLEWNVFKGFSFNFFAQLRYIADRINISQDNLTDEEILLGIRQLDSNFSYFGGFGVSYRFGSQTNNVVNTRF